MLNTLEMERFIAATAKRADLKVKWEQGEHVVPATNGETLILPAMNANITATQYRNLRHAVSHEVDHVLYSDHSLMQKVGISAQNSLLGAIWNAVEDHRIEYLGGKEYEGDRLNSDGVYGDMLEQIAKGAAGAKDNPMVDSLLPIFAWDNKGHSDFYPSGHRVQEQLEKGLSPKAQDYFKKLDGADYMQKMRDIRQIANPKKGTQATLDLAKDIFEKVYDQDAEKEIKRVQEQLKKEQEAKGKGKPKPGNEEGEGGEKGKDKGEGDEDGEQGQGEGGKPANKREEFANIDYSEMMMDAHDPKEMHGKGMHLDFSRWDGSGSYIPATDSDYAISDYTEKAAGTPSPHYTNAIKDALGFTSSGFAHQVRTVLQVRDRDRYQYGLKRGKLNSGTLYRVTMDAQGFNERVFKKKTENNVLDAAITLVVDQSGSMTGDKFSHAAAAAVMLNDVIGNTLHIPVEIVSYTSAGSGTRGGEKVRIAIHRKHKDRLVSRDTLINRMATSAGTDGMGNNADGDAVFWAFDRLVRRPEKRKLLIVFSDGSPAAHTGRGNIAWYTKHVAQSIEQESPVEIVGIGIMDNNVTKFYKQHRVIAKADDLEPALLSVIEEKLR